MSVVANNKTFFFFLNHKTKKKNALTQIKGLFYTETLNALSGS